MAERRLPLSVQDDEGVSREGELLIVRVWRPGLDLRSSADFTIVLVQEPLSPDTAPVEASTVAVCAPSAPVRLPVAARETAASYAGSNGSPLRLPARAMNAYAAGTLLAGRPLVITMQDVFDNGGAPHFDALARELLSTDRRDGPSWQALDEVLSSPRPPAQAMRAERVRAKLIAALRQVDGTTPDAHARDVIDRLRRIAEGASPAHNAAGALAEDAALLRCLIEQPAAARELLAMRAYLAGARPGGADADLAADHAFTLEQLSFLTLLEQPHQLDRLRATFEMFRNAYAFAYVNHHAAYWEEASQLRAALDNAAPAAKAIARLNTLRALGPAVGEVALAGYRSLVSRPSGCDALELQAILLAQPACPECAVSLDDQPPSAEVDRALSALRAALVAQQTRLSGEAVRRILDRGGERLQQFLQIVQAADVAALTQVLDDDLLSFLQELLVEPETPPVLDLLREIARAMPVVDEEQIDADLETLRSLLLEQLAEQRATGS